LSLAILVQRTHRPRSIHARLIDSLVILNFGNLSLACSLLRLVTRLSHLLSRVIRRSLSLIYLSLNTLKRINPRKAILETLAHLPAHILASIAGNPTAVL